MALRVHKKQRSRSLVQDYFCLGASHAPILLVTLLSSQWNLTSTQNMDTVTVNGESRHINCHGAKYGF